MAQFFPDEVYHNSFGRERRGGSGLTAEGQYPNSSRNSSGFSTTDSVHILTTVSLRLLRLVVN